MQPDAKPFLVEKREKSGLSVENLAPPRFVLTLQGSNPRLVGFQFGVAPGALSGKLKSTGIAALIHAIASAIMRSAHEEKQGIRGIPQEKRHQSVRGREASGRSASDGVALD